MKTYLTLWFSSEGADPATVVSRLHGMEFRPLTGQYDHAYDWRRSVTIEEVLGLGTAVRETLKGLQVLYKMETV